MKFKMKTQKHPLILAGFFLFVVSLLIPLGAEGSSAFSGSLKEAFLKTRSNIMRADADGKIGDPAESDVRRETVNRHALPRPDLVITENSGLPEWERCFKDHLSDRLENDDRLWTCVCYDSQGTGARLPCDFDSSKGVEFQNEVFNAYNNVANPNGSMIQEPYDQRFDQYLKSIQAVLDLTDASGNEKFTCSPKDHAFDVLKKLFAECQAYFPTVNTPTQPNIVNTSTWSPPVIHRDWDHPIMVYVPQETPSVEIVSENPDPVSETGIAQNNRTNSTPSATGNTFPSAVTGTGCALNSEAVLPSSWLGYSWVAILVFFKDFSSRRKRNRTRV